MSLLQRQEPQFLRRNTFVHGCLGLLSLAARCETLIVAEVGAASGPVAFGARAAAVPEDGDESIVLALLGVLRLSRELRARLERDAPPLAPTVVDARAGAAPRLRDLAR
jgi:hypothetical protein